MKRALLFLIASLAFAQSANVFQNAVGQFVDQNGHPYAGGYLYTCVAGLSCAPTGGPGTTPTNPLATYTDSTAMVSNPNPVVLDASGKAAIWMTIGASYRLFLTDNSGNTVWTQDHVQAPSGLSVAAITALWQGSCLGTSIFAYLSNGTCGTSTALAALWMGTNCSTAGEPLLNDGNCGGTGTFYQTLGINGTSQMQFARLNLIAGTNMTISSATNVGTNSSDVTFTASNTAGTAFSSLTSGNNSVATMVLQSGASLSTSLGGIINANRIIGTDIASITGTGALVLATAPTLDQLQVTTSLTLPITGSSQCLQVNSAGVVAGSGSTCGGGGGGGFYQTVQVNTAAQTQEPALNIICTNAITCTPTDTAGVRTNVTLATTLEDFPSFNYIGSANIGASVQFFFSNAQTLNVSGGAIVGGLGTSLMKHVNAGNDSVLLYQQLSAFWTGAIDLNIYWTIVPNGGLTGTVKFDVKTACITNGSATTPSYNATQTVTATSPTFGQWITTQLTGVTTGSCAPANQFLVFITRDASDTLPSDVGIIGFTLGIRRTQ